MDGDDEVAEDLDAALDWVGWGLAPVLEDGGSGGFGEGGERSRILAVREQLEAAAKELNIGNLCAMLQFGNMNDELTRYNTQMFGEKVAPGLRGMFSDWDHPYWPANA